MLNTTDLQPTGFVPSLFRPLDDWRVRIVTWFFAFGMASHLWLGDAWTPGWSFANALCVCGTALLLLRPCFVAWALIFVGKLLPLLFLRDQLTQSVVLMTFAFSGMLAHIWQMRGTEVTEDFLLSLRWTATLTYSLATLHKINHDFLNPVTSCANYGMDKLALHWQLPVEFAGWAIWPWFAIALEGAIPLMFSLGRHRLAWVLAVAFHIPLTITMAPAFAFVMFAGLVAYVTDADRAMFLEVLKRYRIQILGSSFVLIGTSMVLATTLPDPSMIFREWVLWAMLVALSIHAVRMWRVERRPIRRPTSWWPRVIAALFIVNGLTPYTGVQYQHAAAMLSNLRIDEGCWNHAIIPESARLTEDYVRIDVGYFGEPGRLVEYEKIMAEQLWNPPQIRQMQRNWCKHPVRPFYVHGTFRGRPFEIQDLCSATDLPFEDDGFFGIEIFPDFLRYQKNLMRECPQACIH